MLLLFKGPLLPLKGSLSCCLNFSHCLFVSLPPLPVAKLPSYQVVKLYPFFDFIHTQNSTPASQGFLHATKIPSARLPILAADFVNSPVHCSWSCLQFGFVLEFRVVQIATIQQIDIGTFTILYPKLKLGMVQSRVFANFKEHKAAVSKRRQKVGARKNCTTTDYPPLGLPNPL